MSEETGVRADEPCECGYVKGSIPIEFQDHPVWAHIKHQVDEQDAELARLRDKITNLTAEIDLLKGQWMREHDLRGAAERERDQWKESWATENRKVLHCQRYHTD
jgi:chromosome segregation ATPase